MEKKFEFKPFDKVLVRHTNGHWHPDLFSNENGKGRFFTIGGGMFAECIPYKGNEHLLGTSDPYEPPYKPKQGDFITFGRNENSLVVGIFKEGTIGKDSNGCMIFEEHEDYCDLEEGELCLPDMEENINTCDGWTCDGMRPATEGEKLALIRMLHEAGKDWDAERMEIVEYKWMPIKGGHYFRPSFEDAESGIKSVEEIWCDVDYELKFLSRGWAFRTEAECQALCDKLNEAIKNIK